jgi:pimeloyl-ACP methyl ester carboxylesterase
VYGIDLIGFGASDKPSGPHVPYSIELFVQLLCDFISYINDQRREQQHQQQQPQPLPSWIVAGNSIGGLYVDKRKTQKKCLPIHIYIYVYIYILEFMP